MRPKVAWILSYSLLYIAYQALIPQPSIVYKVDKTAFVLLLLSPYKDLVEGTLILNLTRQKGGLVTLLRLGIQGEQRRRRTGWRPSCKSYHTQHASSPGVISKLPNLICSKAGRWEYKCGRKRWKAVTWFCKWTRDRLMQMSPYVGSLNTGEGQRRQAAGPSAWNLIMSLSHHKQNRFTLGLGVTPRGIQTYDLK